jgi:hypothetical protein
MKIVARLCLGEVWFGDEQGQKITKYFMSISSTLNIA